MARGAPVADLTPKIDEALDLVRGRRFEAEALDVLGDVVAELFGVAGAVVVARGHDERSDDGDDWQRETHGWRVSQMSGTRNRHIGVG